jgi:6-phosphogluconolactonase
MGEDPEIRVLPDLAALTLAAAAFVHDAAERAIVRHGRCSLVLAGGSTPRTLYERLTADDAPRLPWNLIDVWFGDERCVGPDDPASNYGMARDAMLGQLPVPPENVRRIEGELGARAAADAYDAALRAAFGEMTDGRETFDLVLLGVGTEGHTASLFPDHPALEVRDRWAVPIDPAPPTAIPQVPRVTLTLPALTGAVDVLVLAAGAEKAHVVRGVRDGDTALPATLARGRERTAWLVDREAGA